MQSATLIYMYAAACGFVTAGILGSFYQLVTDKPPQFRVFYDTVSGWIVSIILSAFAAPYIVMRNAVLGRILEQRPVGWLFASIAIAAVWSLCSGIIVLSITFALDQLFA
jgi:hypothetical protein